MTKCIYKSDALNVITKLINENKRQYDTSFHKGKRDALIEVLEEVEKIKGIAVQPVVHAYWIELPKALNPNENPCKCSNCGHILSFMNGYPKSKYCDECGAKMDIIYEDDKIGVIKVTGWGNDVRNLTDEETDIYNSWLEAEAKDTGKNIMDGDAE